MSASWASRVRGGAGWLALALMLALPATLPAAESDTGKVVRRVRIGPAGIQIEESGTADSARHEGGSRGRTQGVIKVGRHGVTVITSEGDTVATDEDVTVHGPGVIVNTGNAGLVRVFADADVPAGRHVEGDVVAVFGSADVAGTVSGDVVAVFGSVRLHPGARVDGDAVAIGGVLDHPADAQVSGQSVALGFMTPGWGIPALPMMLAAVFGGWLVTLFMAWLLALLFGDRMRCVAATASRHTTGSFFLGVLSAPLFVVALVLLFVTVVGIPFALLLPFVYTLAVWTGQIVASYVLGCKLVRRRIGEGGLMGPIAAGTLFVGLFFVAGAALAIPPGPSRTLSLFFAVLGMLLIFGLSAIGTGALLLSRLGGRAPAPEPGQPAAPPQPASTLA